MDFVEDLKRELDSAAAISDHAKRSLLIASVVAEALRSVGQDPILVGGAAVEFYTQGGYATEDIDMIAEGGSDLVRVMRSLGFEKIGKDFVDKKRKIYVEFPGRVLGADERTRTIDTGERRVRIISLEDLIVDRLCAFKFWKSAIDGVNALLLLETGDLDETRLVGRAKSEDVTDALKGVREVREIGIRQKLSRKEANRLLEKKMREI